MNKKVFAGKILDLEAADPEEIISLFPVIGKRWDEYGDETRKGISYMFPGLVIDYVGLKKQAHGDHQGGIRDTLKEALSYLQTNFQKPLKLEDAVRHFGYSKSRFSRLFHDYLGCSDYLIALRWRHAAKMRLNSEMTMPDIALHVGFECLRTFYRAFHTCYQCTPSRYVKEHT